MKKQLTKKPINSPEVTPIREIKNKGYSLDSPVRTAGIPFPLDTNVPDELKEIIDIEQAESDKEYFCEELREKLLQAYRKGKEAGRKEKLNEWLQMMHIKSWDNLLIEEREKGKAQARKEDIEVLELHNIKLDEALKRIKQKLQGEENITE